MEQKHWKSLEILKMTAMKIVLRVKECSKLISDKQRPHPQVCRPIGSRMVYLEGCGFSESPALADLVPEHNQSLPQQNWSLIGA